MRTRAFQPLLPLCLGVSLGFTAGRAGACSLSAPTPHQVTTSAGSAPPERVGEVSLTIRRGVGPQGSGCNGTSMSSCDDIASIGLHFTAPDDDQTAAADLGYKIAAVSGTVPFQLDENAVLAMVDGVNASLWLYWSDDASDTQEPIEFSLTLQAVDSDGNLGPVSDPIVISDPGYSDSGCAVRWLGRAAAPFGWLAVLAGSLGLRRLRRR